MVTMRGKAKQLNKAISLTSMLLVLGASSHADERGSPELAVRCSAYFFMAANAKSMDEFNDYYAGGEYAYNDAVKLIGETAALEKFNAATSEINELIDRKWIDFDKADERYGVICADVLREANNPDTVVASPR